MKRLDRNGFEIEPSTREEQTLGRRQPAWTDSESTHFSAFPSSSRCTLKPGSLD